MIEKYYNAKEAAKVLKRPIASFYRDVEAGLIPFEMEEGKRTGKKFPRVAIDTIAKRQQRPQVGHMKLSFKKSNPANLWKRAQATLELYGEDDYVTYERLLEWNDINDEMFMDVLDNNKLVGGATIMPLNETIIHSLLKDQIREKDIPDKAIRKWNQPRLSVYIPTIEIIASDDEKVDKKRGAFLIKHTIKWALQLSQQYDIKNWYGIGITPEGQNILETLGFTTIEELNNGKRKGYVLENKRRPAKLINQFLAESES